MKVAFFNTKPYDKEYFDIANKDLGHEIGYFTPHLDLASTSLIESHKAVCVFINDDLNADVLVELKDRGVELIALRSAGFNHVDVNKANDIGLAVVRVPAYSPYAVAEHTVGLLMCLNRGIHRAHNRVREGDFSLRNLMGFDVYGKTVAIVGTGKIGQAFAHIMRGFGCRVIAFDPLPNQACIDLGVEYLSWDELLKQADVLSLHCPLAPKTFHLIDDNALSQMRQGVTIINTSRGKLVDTKALIKGLKSGKIGLLGLDVYEEEEALFFEDSSSTGIQDDVLARLTTFPNVIVTSHQGFFTHEAMSNIAQTTLSNITAYERFNRLENRVSSL
jgi:D-lactate dehydrogenase